MWKDGWKLWGSKERASTGDVDREKLFSTEKKLSTLVNRESTKKGGKLSCSLLRSKLPYGPILRASLFIPAVDVGGDVLDDLRLLRVAFDGLLDLADGVDDRAVVPEMCIRDRSQTSPGRA